MLGKFLHNKALTYGYSNARVKAMKKELLSRQQLEEMSDVGSIAAVMEMLERSTYKEDLVALSLKSRDADLVELALGRGYGKAARKVMRITPKEARSTVEAVLERWHVQNLKMIMYAKQLGKKREEIEPYIVPVGTVPMKELMKLADAESLEQGIKGLRGNPYGAIIAEGLREKKSIEEICAKLDAHYYGTIAAKIPATDREGSVILDLMRSEIDAKNIMTALRCKLGKVEAKKALPLMIGGGNLSDGALRDIVETEDVEKAVMMLRLGRKIQLKDALEKYKRDGLLAHFEIALEGLIAARGLKALHRSIMSVGALVGFLLLKEEEMNNVRKIVRMKQFNAPKERIREMIVVAG